MDGIVRHSGLSSAELVEYKKGRNVTMDKCSSNFSIKRGRVSLLELEDKKGKK